VAGLRLLVVEDDVLLRSSIVRHLRARGHEVQVADGVALGREIVVSEQIDAVLLDLTLSDGDGMDLLAAIGRSPSPPRTIVITGDPSQATAIAAFRRGARDFLVKPFASESIDAAIERLWAEARPAPSGPALPTAVRRFAPDMVGESPELLAALGVAERVARTDSTVLVRGETGTGKELVARAIHEASPRAAGPFVALNSATIPPDLSELELFGAARGAYTGAVTARVGKLVAARGGTVFLDEIAEMPLSVQAKLLRALQEREICALGDTRTVKIDVRVIAATHADLDAMVEAKRFRADLLYRLDVVRVELPPLRRRRSDLALLVPHFLARIAKRHRLDHDGASLAPATMALFEQHPWPGNVRQLENVLESALMVRPDGALEIDDLPRRFREQASEVVGASSVLPPSGLDLKDVLERLEQELIRQALDRTGGNRTRAAALLGLNRTTLVEKLRKMGIERE
jgi:DNA-binding NtrC family response regulator